MGLRFGEELCHGRHMQKTEASRAAFVFQNFFLIKWRRVRVMAFRRGTVQEEMALYAKDTLFS